MEFIIRRAEIEDAEMISKLFGQLGYEIDSDLITEKYDSLVGRAGDRILVAEVGRVVVGVIGFHVIPMLHRDNDLGRITVLVVDGGYRGQGIGKRLVGEVMKMAREMGCGRMEVTSGDHRPRAHEFYLNLGYQCDERRFIYHF